MKRIVIVPAVIILVLSLSACSSMEKGTETGKQTDSRQIEQSAANNSKDSQPVAETSVSKKQKETTWPEEFTKWDIPTISSAKVVSYDNKSVSDGVVTHGINVVTNLKNVSRQDFESYCKDLESNGYKKAPDSLADVMILYEKNVEGGMIKLTLSYSDDSTTIIANNSAAAANKDKQAPVSINWPDSVKGIPEFTKGKYKETTEMGGGMYAITFSGVSESDLDWYRKILKAEGFEPQEDADTEGYAKLDKDKAYSVGFILNEDTLQLVVLSGSY